VNVVPFTTAARYGVWTPKWGVIFFWILYTAVPKSSNICMMPPLLSAVGRRSCVAAETMTYSSPRTRTARAPAPVVTVSPGLSVTPRTAARTLLARFSCTGPLTSVTRQSGVPASAALLHRRARDATPSAILRIMPGFLVSKAHWSVVHPPPVLIRLYRPVGFRVVLDQS